MATMSRVASAPADIMPRGTPHLHKIRPKDPVELENHGYVSSRMGGDSLSCFIASIVQFLIFLVSVLYVIVNLLWRLSYSHICEL